MLYAAVAYAMSGKDAKATQLLQRVVELEPTNAQARWRLAALLYDLMDYEQALLHFREAVRLDPQDEYSREMVGTVQSKLAIEN